MQNKLMDVYRKLYKAYGPQGWWPGKTRLEIIVGAILTQNTAWTNVEKAIRNLRSQRALSSPDMLIKIPKKRLARMIRPSGYYNIKAGRLKNFLAFLKVRYGGSLRKMSLQKTVRLRHELLSVNGIGPETCDSILLYAFNKPVFVVDAYTKRVFSGLGLLKETAKYDEAQRLFMDNLPPDVKLYNEYHALIVRHAKNFR